MTEISEEPCLFDEDIAPSDVKQGRVGNCWMCCQLSSAASEDGIHIRGSIYPEEVNPAGIYGVRVFKEGEWYMILIDDHLPVEGDSLVFMYSKNPNEFWSALFEKAFAKISGSYQDLSAGINRGLEPMTTITGYPMYTYALADSAENTELLWENLVRLFDAGCLMSGGTQDAGDSGLVQGHGYSVLGYYQDEMDPEIRNGEWNGPWSDDSDEWMCYPDVLEATGHDIDAGADDGIFWMPIENYVSIFSGYQVVPTGEWPPEGEDVPEMLSTPTQLKFCYPDDYVEHKGAEGYEQTTRKIVPMIAQGGSAEHNEIMHGHNGPQ
ncbi:peptidase C2, calpain family, partial [Kipferlia bialata]|eukprot:g9214.t1